VSIATCAAFAVLPGVARAGTLYTSTGGYGEENVEYRVGSLRRPGPPSVIFLRTLSDGRLVIEDRSSQIVFDSPDSPLACRLHARRHVAVCREPARFAIGSVTVAGGPHNDVIDARSLKATSVRLVGGAGDDTLLAPRHRPNAYSTTVLEGGSGRNVIVGGPGADVSYRDARGPVRADLAKGFGFAPGERDHIVGVNSVTGSRGFYNRLAGSRLGGHISGGARGNTILTRSSRTTVGFEGAGERPAHGFQPTLLGEVRVPSRVRCLAFSRVIEPAPEDVLTGHCTVHDLALHLPMRTAGSAPVTVGSGVATHEGRRLVLTAGTVVVGEVRTPPGAHAVPCTLNAVGQELLRSSRRLLVFVSEFSGSTTAPGGDSLWSRFSTVLALRGR